MRVSITRTRRLAVAAALALVITAALDLARARSAAHARGRAVSLKNDGDQAGRWSQPSTSPSLRAPRVRPLRALHRRQQAGLGDAFRADANRLNLNALRKHEELDAWRDAWRDACH